MINFGIVGLGRIGKVHLSNIQRYCKDAQVVAGCSINHDKKAFLHQNGVEKHYTTLVDMLADKAIDAVVIASPTAFHYEHILLAAEAGKHVFCEKPIDLSIAHVKKVVETIEATGIHFMVGFNRRFDPHVLQLKNAIKNGKTGSPQIVKITSRDPGPPPLDYIKTSGGLFLDMAIHDFDMARYLVADEVVRVHSTGTIFGNLPLAQYEDIDTAVTTLMFKGGAMAVIDNSRNSCYGYDQRIEVFGAKGMYGTKNIVEDALFYRDGDGYHSARPQHFFMERYADSYRNIIHHFVEGLINEKKPSITAQDGLAALSIALAAKQAVKQKQAVDTIHPAIN